MNFNYRHQRTRVAYRKIGFVASYLQVQVPPLAPYTL